MYRRRSLIHLRYWCLSTKYDAATCMWQFSYFELIIHTSHCIGSGVFQTIKFCYLKWYSQQQYGIMKYNSLYSEIAVQSYRKSVIPYHKVLAVGYSNRPYMMFFFFFFFLWIIFSVYDIVILSFRQLTPLLLFTFDTFCPILIKFTHAVEIEGLKGQYYKTYFPLWFSHYDGWIMTYTAYFL